MKLHQKHNHKNRRGGLASKLKNPSVPLRKSVGLYKLEKEDKNGHNKDYKRIER